MITAFNILTSRKNENFVNKKFLRSCIQDVISINTIATATILLITTILSFTTIILCKKYLNFYFLKKHIAVSFSILTFTSSFIVLTLSISLLAMNCFSIYLSYLGYKAIHLLIGNILFQHYVSCAKEHPNKIKNETKIETKKVNGFKVSITIEKRYKKNNRYIIVSPPMLACPYENPNYYKYYDFANEVKGNLVFFHADSYIGNIFHRDKNTMIKVHQEVLKFIINKKQPKELILLGSSLGGALQRESLSKIKNKKDLFQNTKIMCLSIHSFSSLFKLFFYGGNSKHRSQKDSKIISITYITLRILWVIGAFIIKFFGWDLGSANIPNIKEIAVQRVGENDHNNWINNPDKIIDDNLVPIKATLANQFFSNQKSVLGIKYNHFDPMPLPQDKKILSELTKKIEEILSKNKIPKKE